MSNQHNHYQLFAMKACIAIILLFFTTTINAQNIDDSSRPSTTFDNYVWNCALGEDSEYANTSIGTDIFGDQFKTYSEPSGGLLLTVKRSKNIFGNKVTTVTNRQGITLLELQKTTDIFGTETVKITGYNGQLLGSITRSVDIFGAKKTEIRDVAHNTTTIITASTDIFNNRQISISGPKNSYENMLAGFVAELKY